jgi:hypothetical protein
MQWRHRHYFDVSFDISVRSILLPVIDLDLHGRHAASHIEVTAQNL